MRNIKSEKFFRACRGGFAYIRRFFTGKNLFFAAFLALCIFRCSYLRFSYIPYLDDYVQYRLYPSIENPVKNIFFGGAGTLTTRPLAGLLDFYVISRFWDRLGIMFFALSAAYAASGIVFFRAFEELGIPLTPIFLCVYALAPINSEGIFWISASSRLAPPLLFAALACLYTAKKRLIPAAIFTFVSVWFYEQAAALSLAAVTIFALLGRQKNGTAFATKSIAAAVFAFLVLGAYYIIFGKSGNNGHRLTIVPPAELWSHNLEFIKNAAEMCGGVQLNLIFRGTLRGMQMIMSESRYVWLIALVALCAWVFGLSARVGFKAAAIRTKLICGILLAAAPAVPFWVSENLWLNFRNAVPSLLGAALILDAVLPLLFRSQTPAVWVSVILVFMLVSVSETCDYVTTARRDMELALKICEKVPPAEADGTDLITYSTDAPLYFPQNSPYHDHIASMRASEWGISGIIRALSGNHSVTVEKSE